MNTLKTTLLMAVLTVLRVTAGEVLGGDGGRAEKPRRQSEDQ